jgi:hypothetical protein
MKNLVLFLAIGLFSVVFTSCDNASDDIEMLVGTTWKAKTDNSNLELRFVNDSICTLRSGRNDVSMSANLSTYIYERGIGIDIFMFIQMDNQIITEWAGNFDGNTTIRLSKVVDSILNDDYLVFKRQK